MANNYENDRKLVARIKKGDRIALGEIYRENYPSIRSFVCKNSGTLQDAEDLYQEVIVVFYKAVKAGKLDDIRSSINTFLYGVAKKMWFYRLRIENNNPEESIDINIHVKNSDENPVYYPEEQNEKLQQALKLLRSPCKDILRDFYIFRHTMEHIAKKYGYNNANTAKSKKHKCINKIRNILNNL